MMGIMELMAALVALVCGQYVLVGKLLYRMGKLETELKIIKELVLNNYKRKGGRRWKSR